MKHFLVIALAVLVGTTPAAAEVKSVPKEALAWYKDTMGLYTVLVKALDKAKDAKQTADAFRQATATVKAKDLVARYRALKKKFPDFFQATGDETWVPPQDWIQTMQDYSQVLATYSQGMQKAMAYAQDPGVQGQLEAFSLIWDSLDSED